MFAAKGKELTSLRTFANDMHYATTPQIGDFYKVNLYCTACTVCVLCICVTKPHIDDTVLT